MTKASWILAASLATTSLFANGEDCFVVYRPGEPICDELAEGILYPADYYICDRNCAEFFIAGEFLYWQYKRQGSQQEQIGQLQMPVGNVTTNISLRDHTDYKPAFRITAGVDFPSFDHWTAQVAYTWYHGDNTTHRSATLPNFITPRNAVTPQVSSSALTSELDIKFNFLSGTVGRPSYFGQRLILNPFFGLKGFWMEQSNLMNFTPNVGLPGSISWKGRAWGIGPHAGVNLKGLAWWGFYLTGNVAITEAYIDLPKAERIVNFPSSGANNVLTSFKGPNTQLAEIFEGSIGIGWSTYFWCNSYHVDLAAAYDFITIPDMVGLPSFVAIAEVYLQGLSIKAQLDF